jgi:hypothetical protein
MKLASVSFVVEMDRIVAAETGVAEALWDIRGIS